MAVSTESPVPQPTRTRRLRSLPPRRVLLSDAVARYLSRLAALALWSVAGLLFERIPTPWATVDFIGDEIGRGELFNNLAITAARAGAGLSLVLVVGIATGIAMARWFPVRWALTDLVMIGIALPAFIWALLSVMWWGFSDIGPIFTCFISATPMLVVNTREGALAVSEDLRKMSQAYRVPRRRQLRSLVLPSMAEYIIAGFRVAVLAGWGAVLLVEWFGNDRGAGERAQYWYNANNFSGMLAWGVVMLAVIVLIDRLVLERVLRRASQWRTGLNL
jgi:ABC-type nitrate/sulfonate/bicarbonate transport system permease component